MPNNFSYNTNIPAAPNNPSADQPLMQTNTNSIASLIAVDHVGFGVNGGGTHKQVTLTNEAAPGLGDGTGVLYANLASGQSWPFWQNALGSVQLAGLAASIAASGYITLQGGLILQWGNQASSGGVVTVNLPLTFPNNYFTSYATMRRNSSNVDAIYSITAPNVGATASIQFRDTSSGNPFFWFAIGN